MIGANLESDGTRLEIETKEPAGHDGSGVQSDVDSEEDAKRGIRHHQAEKDQKPRRREARIPMDLEEVDNFVSRGSTAAGNAENTILFLRTRLLDNRNNCALTAQF